MRRTNVTIPAGWSALNDLVMSLGEAECVALLKAEKAGRCRVRWLLRIRSRLSRLRADRERSELRRIAVE